jgi:nicotinamidase-related amidase
MWHLLVVDIQEAFAPHIHHWEPLLARCAVMIKAARALGLPITATEQNPSKLGHTVAPIAALLDGVPLFEKMAFSALRVPAVWNRIAARGPVNLILVGIESHVCILQTALTALGMGTAVTPYLPLDAIGSRRVLDRDTAFRRLEQGGAVATTVESVILEIVQEAGTDRFRSVLSLIR